MIVVLESISKTSEKFTKVTYKEVDTGTHGCISMRGNGISLNYNERGKYEHYLSYISLEFIKIKKMKKNEI